MHVIARGVCVKYCRLAGVGWFVCSLIFSGCAGSQPKAELDLADRPFVAILPVGFEIEITHLASIKSVDGALAPEEEARQLAEALQHVREEARWLLQSRLAAGQRVQFVPDEQVAAIAKEVGLAPGVSPPSSNWLNYGLGRAQTSSLWSIFKTMARSGGHGQRRACSPI